MGSRWRWAVASAVCLAAATAACGEAHSRADSSADSTVTIDGSGGAELVIAPALQDYGDVGLDEEWREASFVVQNVGDALSGPLAVEVEGDPGFRLAANECVDPLGPMAECRVAVRFAPESVGAAFGTLRVSDAATSAVANLEASVFTGINRWTIMPTPFDFGRVEVGRVSATQAFTVRNPGREASGPVMVTLAGPGSDHFQIVSEDCSDGIAAEGTCTVIARYAPISPGLHDAEVQVSGRDRIGAAVAGMAFVGPVLQLVPGVQDFGAPCSLSATVTFTLTNVGGGATEPLAISVMGADAAEFEVVTATCEGVLASGASCTIDMVYRPMFPTGFKEADLSVTDGTVTASAHLTATYPSCDSGPLIVPSTYDFGPVARGMRSADAIFTISNPGGSPLVLSSVGIVGTDFLLAADGCTGVSVPPGGSCTVAVAFEPTAAGARLATLRVSSSPPGAATAALVGTGL